MNIPPIAVHEANMCGSPYCNDLQLLSLAAMRGDYDRQPYTALPSLTCSNIIAIFTDSRKAGRGKASNRSSADKAALSTGNRSPLDPDHVPLLSRPRHLMRCGMMAGPDLQENRLALRQRKCNARSWALRHAGSRSLQVAERKGSCLSLRHMRGAAASPLRTTA